MMYPIQCKADYKSLTQQNKQLPPYYIPGTAGGASLQQELLKEYQKTQKLIQISSQIQKTNRKEKSQIHTQSPGAGKPRNQGLSPLALRRAYLPRSGGRKPQAAHHPAKAAAAAAQEKHPQNHHRAKEKAENATTTNRDVRITLTRFKPGFEQQTEYELACAFNRPMRTYKEDKPYYPWLPIEPKVNFHLNFTG